jgi:hypothetical protein
MTAAHSLEFSFHREHNYLLLEGTYAEFEGHLWIRGWLQRP